MMEDGNTTAAARHDRDQAKREASLPSYEAALESLVDLMVDGKRFPATTTDYVSRLSILEETDGAELASIIDVALRRGSVEGYRYLQEEAKKRLNSHLDGSKWVDMRWDELAKEAEEDRHD